MACRPTKAQVDLELERHVHRNDEVRLLEQAVIQRDILNRDEALDKDGSFPALPWSGSQVSSLPTRQRLVHSLMSYRILLIFRCRHISNYIGWQ